MEIRGSGHLNFDRAVSSRSVNSLRIHLREVDHVSLYSLVGMGIAISAAARESLPISLELPTKSSSVCAFVSRLGFDRFVQEVGGIPCELPLTARQDPRDVLVEMRRFSSSAELTPLQDLLWNRLDGVARPDAREALLEALWELGANVLEHSQSEGIVAAVVFGERRQAHVEFAIGDAGIGIRQSFLKGKGSYRPNSDHEAITLATRYLVSSTDDPGRGQGLATTVEQATGLGGKVLIRTGTATRQITLDRDASGGPRLRPTAASVAHVPGTLVAVSIPCR